MNEFLYILCQVSAYFALGEVLSVPDIGIGYAPVVIPTTDAFDTPLNIDDINHRK